MRLVLEVLWYYCRVTLFAVSYFSTFMTHGKLSLIIMRLLLSYRPVRWFVDTSVEHGTFHTLLPKGKIRDLKKKATLIHVPLDKCPPFRRRHFQTHFHEWKKLNFKQNFIEMCSLGSNWQYISISSDNSLAPSGRQAIIWSNADPVHRRIYVALGGDELILLKKCFT